MGLAEPPTSGNSPPGGWSHAASFEEKSGGCGAWAPAYDASTSADSTPPTRRRFLDANADTVPSKRRPPATHKRSTDGRRREFAPPLPSTAGKSGGIVGGGRTE